MRSAETLSQSPVDAASPQHSPIGRGPQFPSGMTSTVTILPSSPLDLSRNSFSASLAPHYGTHTQTHRPKLSLNTTCSQQRTLGKGNTGLRLDTLSASSPTVRNTYKNSYEAPTCPPTPFKALESSPHPLKGQLGARADRAPSLKPPTPHPLQEPAASDDSTPSSSSSQDGGLAPSDPNPTSSPPREVPYVLGKHPRSILVNSPVPKRHRSHGDIKETQASQSHHERRRSCPLRRVGFHAKIEERIHTEKYTAQHYDLIVASSPSPIDNVNACAGSKRDSPTDGTRGQDAGVDDASEDESYPKTPVAGRKKRRREWVWTLGPIDGVPPSNGNAENGCG